jgi:hypothetical protein
MYYYSIRMHSYAHPQDLKVLKHCVYIQYGYGCGMHLMGVCSLNHDTTTSLLGHTPFSQKFHPHLHMYYSIRMNPYAYAHPQHLRVLKHFVYIQYGCGMHLMGVCSFNHDTTSSLGLGHTTVFLKFTPKPAHVLQHNDAPICSYTASQGAKTLFIHLIWMWDAVNGGWQSSVKVFPWYKSQYRVSH